MSGWEAMQQGAPDPFFAAGRKATGGPVRSLRAFIDDSYVIPYDKAAEAAPTTSASTPKSPFPRMRGKRACDE